MLALTVDVNLNLYNSATRSIGRFPNYLAVLYGRIALGFFPATVRLVGAFGLLFVGLQAFGVLIIDLTTGSGYYTKYMRPLDVRFFLMQSLSIYSIRYSWYVVLATYFLVNLSSRMVENVCTNPFQ